MLSNLETELTYFVKNYVRKMRQTYYFQDAIITLTTHYHLRQLGRVVHLLQLMNLHYYHPESIL